MPVQFGIAQSEDMINPNPERKIVFVEHLAERSFDVPDDSTLASVCLMILRERYSNPAWGYEPKIAKEFVLTEEEQEFLRWFERTDLETLPILLRKHAVRISSQLNQTSNTTNKNEWNWYEAVTMLLNLPKEEAVPSCRAYKGQQIPTALYLLLQRRHNHGEGLRLGLT